MAMSTTKGPISAAGASLLKAQNTNHKVKIFLQVETCAPFLDRYGGVVFVYDWNVAKDMITDYYHRQYPDGWVKVLPFSLRNIMSAIKDLDHRLDRYENVEEGVSSLANGYNAIRHGGGSPDASICPNENVISSSTSSTDASKAGSTRSINSLVRSGSNMSTTASEAKKQHQIVFLLTGSMNPEYGIFGLTQKKILDAVKDALPERVKAVTVIGHCMYGCASCSGAEHKIPLYFTRYFNKTLPYTAQDIRALYASPNSGSTTNNAHAVLVAPSCGSTSMIAQKPLIQLFHRLEQTGRWKFIWKMHPTSLLLKGYDLTDPSGVEQTELENVKFILENFSVTQNEHACLLPFIEGFDVIITDLHSSVPFIATYFTPKVILSYFNDADYGAPERHQAFMDQLNTFVEPEELEGLLNNLPQAKGDPSFFHSQYGHVDGQEDLRFGDLAGWPTEQFEPTGPFQYRKVMAQIAVEWRKLYKDAIEAHPDDVAGANNALGFADKFELLKDDDLLVKPITLPRILPRNRQAAGIELRIMSYNIWNGGLSSGLPLKQTAKAILASGADVVGLQECSTVIEASGCRRYMLPELMKYLPGWYYSDQKLRSTSTGRRNPWGVVSKFPIVGTTEKGYGVKIQLNNHRHPDIEPVYHDPPEDEYPPVERRLSLSSLLSNIGVNGAGHGGSNSSLHRTVGTRFMYLFNCHLFYFPYQPFQLLKIPYGNQPYLDTPEEAIQSCHATRGKEMETVLSEIKQVADQEQDVPIFLTGDFNEPSHLDWTSLSVLAGLQPMTIRWPMTEMAYKAGLVDLWRAYRHSPSYPPPSGSGSGAAPLPSSPTRQHSTGSNNSLLSSVSHCSLNGYVAHGPTHQGCENWSEKDKIDSQVIERPGFTWTVLLPELDEADHYDRIDYIFGLNRESSPIALKEMAIKMGEEVNRSGEKNEKVLRPWPSDHRTVVATVVV
ncbi:hypothetical protein EDD11_004380 [Mortierella claussenii]|nr:hypothetical protein EDD11_004380 [Mortierella claussenii]